jgi:hypothetical protein
MLFDPANDWAMQEGIELPRGTQQILHSPQHGLLALAANGLFRADADGLEVAEETIEAPQSGGFLSGMQRLLGREQGPFELISPDTLGIFNPAAIALVPDSGDVIVYSAGTVYRLTPGEPGAVLQTAATQLLEGDNSGPSAVAVVDNRVVIARKAEPLVALDLATLAPRADEPFDTSRTITSLHALPRGRTLLGTTSDRRVVRLTLEEERLEVAPAGLPHGRNTHGLTVGEQGRVWLAHDIDFLTAVDPASGAVVRQLEPTRDFWRRLDALLITPLRTIIPQTSELGETVVAVICGRSDLEIVTGGQTQQEKLDVVRPLATCGGFIVFMLGLGCLYVYRQDF